MFNKMTNTAKSRKEIKKQIKKDKKKNCRLLKNKENFMKMRGYRIKVGEDSYILFKNEEYYLLMLYFEKVFFDLHKQLFNRKEVISLLFRLETFKTYIINCTAILIHVYYDKRKCENPLKIKFPNLSCCEDNEMRMEIEDEIEDLNNDQLMDYYEDIKVILSRIIKVDYKNKEKIYEPFKLYKTYDPERDPFEDELEIMAEIYISDDENNYNPENKEYECLLDYD